LSLAAAPALAQDRALTAASSREAVKEAREHFGAASAHYRAGRFREALREFELAERLVPSPELSFNIARAHEQLGEIEAAIARYERYVAAGGDASDVASVQARIDALRASLEDKPVRAADTAALRIDADPGAAIKLDGADLGVAPIDRIVWVEPGEHILEATLPGHAPYRAEIAAPPGAMVAGNVELVQYSKAPARGERVRSASARQASGGSALPVWIAGGASVASAVVSGAARASSEASRSDGDLDSAHSADTVAGVALASALTSGVLAAVLYFAAPHHEESRQVLQ
jgi:tetratricopeptide (TPR) repeat protein